jgi:ribonuclease D
MRRLSVMGQSLYTRGAMTMISDSSALLDFCQRQATAEFVTIDTEFIRDNSYWPKLCLVQVAGDEEAVAIDPLAEAIDLAPLLGLLAAPAILKVFHAARQDLEIFYHMTGKLPAPVFDTQVAAMVCGYGDQASYEKLVASIAKARVDKASRFSDWSRRPLTQRMLDYALSDVTHLRKIYQALATQLADNGRSEWLAEEMDRLTDPATYALDPDQAWKRLKSRSRDRRYLAVLQHLAAWREREAQERDLPRNRVLRDEQLLDIAAHAPTKVEILARTRGLSNDYARGRLGRGILATVAEALALPGEALPKAPAVKRNEEAPAPLVDLLRVMLKHKCDEHGVAQKLVASANDLDQIALDDEAQVPAMSGWRRELFGKDALALKHGKLALSAQGGTVRLIPLDGRQA